MPPPNLRNIDSSFQLAEYLALLIKRDPRDVEGIVDLPASGSSASQASQEKAKTTYKEKDGQGERQGADVVGSPNGSGNSSGRKKEVDLVSFLFSALPPILSGIRSLRPRSCPRLEVFRVVAFTICRSQFPLHCHSGAESSRFQPKVSWQPEPVDEQKRRSKT